jgi:hypothetical protein
MRHITFWISAASSVVNTLVTRSSHAEDTLASEYGASLQRVRTLSFTVHHEPRIQARRATTHEPILPTKRQLTAGQCRHTAFTSTL